jgi:hypothetical protein
MWHRITWYRRVLTIQNVLSNEMSRYKAASVLPYSRVENQYYFLLGREVDDGTWSDFGGGVNPEDNNIIYTAARECYEESMGLLGSIEDIYQQIHAVKGFDLGNGMVFPMEIPYDPDLPRTFKRVFEYGMTGLDTKKIPEGWYEKNEVRWFFYHQVVEIRSKLRRHLAGNFEKVFDAKMWADKMESWILPYTIWEDKVIILLGEKQFSVITGTESWMLFGESIGSNAPSIEKLCANAYADSMGFLGSPKDIQKKLEEPFLFQRTKIYPLQVTLDHDMSTFYARIFDYFISCAQTDRRTKSLVIPSCNNLYKRRRIGWFTVDPVTTQVVPLFTSKDFDPQNLKLDRLLNSYFVSTIQTKLGPGIKIASDYGGRFS